MYYDTQDRLYSESGNAPAESLGQYTAKTFAWMFAGLLTTFLIAVLGYTTGAIFYVFAIPYAPFVLAIAEIAVVLFLSAKIQKLSVGAARALFFTYAVLNGVVFSAYFLLYDVTILLLVFAVTSVFFGIMAVLGYATKVDFSRLRNFLFAGLIFLAAFWLLSMFLNLQAFEVAVCYIGIFIFLGFTVYDTTKIRDFYAYYSQDSDMAAKASIFSALNLYLDFINLFLYIIRIIGNRRN